MHAGGVAAERDVAGQLVDLVAEGETGATPRLQRRSVRHGFDREINREFSRFGPLCTFLMPRQASEFKGLQPNSLCNRTENFQTRIRENYSRNRESLARDAFALNWALRKSIL